MTADASPVAPRRRATSELLDAARLNEIEVRIARGEPVADAVWAVISSPIGFARYANGASRPQRAVALLRVLSNLRARVAAQEIGS